MAKRNTDSIILGVLDVMQGHINSINVEIKDINKKLMKDLEDIAEFGFKRLQQLESELQLRKNVANPHESKALNITNVTKCAILETMHEEIFNEFHKLRRGKGNKSGNKHTKQ